MSKLKPKNLEQPAPAKRGKPAWYAARPAWYKAPDQPGYKAPGQPIPKPRRGNPAWYDKDGKGVSGNPQGRKKGSQNKISRTIREMVLAAVDSYAGGGVALMERYRDSAYKEERIAFLALVGKLVPMEVTGAGGGALIVEVVMEQKPEWRQHED